VEALVAFAATLLALRLGGRLAARWRERPMPHLAAWSGSLLAFALAAAALSWGAAAGWNEAAFRLYYLFGGLLTAPLLGAGSLLLVGQRWVLPAALVYVGLAIGIAAGAPLTAPVTGSDIPDAGEHLDLFPTRMVAVVGNVAGTLASRSSPSGDARSETRSSSPASSSQRPEARCSVSARRRPPPRSRSLLYSSTPASSPGAELDAAARERRQTARPTARSPTSGSSSTISPPVPP
jgi:hypothetical protein